MKSFAVSIALVLSLNFQSPSAHAEEDIIIVDGPERNGVRRIVPMQDGGFLLSGWAGGIVDKKDDNTGGWLVRVDSEGEILWDQNHLNRLPTRRGAQASNHIIDRDGTIIFVLEEYRNKGPYSSEGSTGQASLWRYSVDGELISTKLMGSSGIDVIDEVIPMPDGSYIMGGESTSPIQKGYDGWIFKTDADFNIVWDVKAGGFGAERFNQIIETPEGNFLGVGRTTTDEGDFRAWAVLFDTDGNQLWEKRYREDMYANTIRGVIPLQGGGWVFSGFTINHPSDPDPRNLWIGRLDAEGDLLWDKAIGGKGADVSYVISQANSGAFLAAGTTQSDVGEPFDAYVVAFNEDGKVLAERTHGAVADSETIRGIIPYGDGYVLSGNVEFADGERQKTLLIKVEEVLP